MDEDEPKDDDFGKQNLLFQKVRTWNFCSIDTSSEHPWQIQSLLSPVPGD